MNYTSTITGIQERTGKSGHTGKSGQVRAGLAHVKKPALKKPVFIAGFFGFFQVKFEKNR